MSLNSGNSKRFIIFGVAVAAIVVVVFSMSDIHLWHKWEEATCTEPKTCSVCGETEGEALGHEWEAATCTDPITCSVCGATEGEALGHVWEAATCTDPKTCSVCGATEGEALGHVWKAATCAAPQTCSVCGATEGEALADGHKWKEATCTEPKTCSVCGTTEGEAMGHIYNDATCTEPKTCGICGATEGEALGHVYDAPTCTGDQTCNRCGYMRPQTWHVIRDMSTGVCEKCGEIIYGDEIVIDSYGLLNSFFEWTYSNETRQFTIELNDWFKEYYSISSGKIVINVDFYSRETRIKESDAGLYITLAGKGVVYEIPFNSNRFKAGVVSVFPDGEITLVRE